jgi:hypothetical protein
VVIAEGDKLVTYLCPKDYRRTPQNMTYVSFPGHATVDRLSRLTSASSRLGAKAVESTGKENPPYGGGILKR